MTVFPLADGRYRAKEGEFQREGKTRKIAKDRLLALLADTARLKPQPSMTVSALIDVAVAQCKDAVEAGEMSSNTLRDYNHHAKFVREAIGHYKVSALTGRIIKEEVLEGKPTKTQVNRRAFLRAIINKVIKPDFPEFANPAEFAKPAQYKAVGARPLFGSETAELLKAEQNPMHMAMWLLLLDSGIRPDEAYGLMWTEIIREDDGWWLYLESSKTEEGLEPVPLAETTVEALRGVAKDMKWVFPSPMKKGQPLGQTYWCDRFRELVNKSDLKNKARVTPYSLRHTFACNMARTAKDEILQRLMRHKDVRTTKQYYTEVSKAELRAAKS